MSKESTTSPSPKSGSDSRQPAPNWRLKKTLARKVSFRPIEADDVRYAWAAYKKGSLVSLGDTFLDGKLSAEEFKEAFETEITVRYHGVWTLFAETKKGNIPVCFVLAFWCHPEARLAPYMILDQLTWLPWAGARARIESATNFFNSIRNEIPMIGYAREKDKKFFEVMMKHGIMRRIGTSFNVFPDEPAAVYETRKP